MGFFIISYFVFLCLATSSYGWVCDYWIADIHGKAMNQIIAEKGLGWSLHGAWNERGNHSDCLSYDQFFSDYA